MPKGIRKLHIAVGEYNLTHFGGIPLIHAFCKNLRLRWLLQAYVQFPQRSSRYHPIDIILTIIYAIIVGIYRLSKTKILQGNSSFQRIIGLKSFPYASSLRRCLKRVDHKAIQGINKVHNHLRLKMFYFNPRTSLLFDLDSSILTIYGKFIEEAKKRLQPSQKRQAFLSSLTLLRISHQKFLAWSLKAWRCLYRSWLSGVLGRVSGQDASLHISYTAKSRFRFLRSQVYRTFRREKHRLRYCGQANASHKKTAGRSMLSQFQEGLGSCRILLQTLEMEKFSSLCSNTQTVTGKRLRTTYTFHHDPLCLSGVCKQPSTKATKRLVFLQGQSRHRADYQRAQGRLHVSQHSDEQFPSQSNLLLSTAFCIQHSQLVQDDLLTYTISERYFRNDSGKVPFVTSKIGKNRQPQCAQDTGAIYFQTNIGADYAQN